MKLVIDIPQGMIDAFSHEEQWTAVLCKDMSTVLQNGIPLPKGHGDLVDRDAVYRAYDYSDMEYTMLNALDDATAIIEADMRGDV